MTKEQGKDTYDRSERLKKISTFVNKLRDLIGEENLQPKRFADKIQVTVPYASNLLRGYRAPSLDTLCAIAISFHLPFEDVANCLVHDDNIKYDHNGKRQISVFIMNNGRGPTAGAIKFLNEEELESFYGHEYNPLLYLEFVKRYLIDKLYKDRYEPAMSNVYEKLNTPKSIEGRIKSNSLFHDIVLELNNMDDYGLQFVKDQMDIYMKHYNNK